MSLRFTTVPMQNGQFTWRLHTSNNELLARAGVGLDTFAAARRAAAAFKARSQDVVFEIYLNDSGEWRWRAWHSNTIVARSCEAFATRSTAERSCANVRVNAATADGA